MYQRRNTGGVTMPGNILPAQKEANVYTFFTTGGSVDISDQSVTYLAPSLAASSVRIQQALTSTISLLMYGNNAITSENLADILASINTEATSRGVTSGTLSMAGPNMGTPVTVAHVGGEIVLDFAGINSAEMKAAYDDSVFNGDDPNPNTQFDGGTLPFNKAFNSGAGTAMHFRFDPASPLVNSNTSGVNEISIGISDTPSVSLIVSKIFELLPASAISGNTVIFTYAADTDLPVGDWAAPDTGHGPDAGVAQASHTAGVAKVLNADLTAIIALGVHGDYANPDHTTSTF